MAEAITFLFELIGTVAFAASGALVAMEKRMDILGVTILGITTAVGGGVIRDVVLGHTPPQAFVKPIYTIVAVVVSLILFIPQIRRLLQRRQLLFDKILLIMDSLGLGVFTVVGIRTAYDASANLSLLLFVGVITGVGGGALRDIMSGSMPFIFVKYFYCSASIIGALITVAIWEPLGSQIAMYLGAAVIFVLRLLAAHYLWKLPRA